MLLSHFLLSYFNRHPLLPPIVLLTQGTATPTKVGAPPSWPGSGCPKVYAAGTNYAAGDVVRVKTKQAWDIVYTCKEEPSNLFCGMAGYEPSQGQYTSQAWVEAGSCMGTMSPTDSTVFISLNDEGGCPAAFDGSADYEVGDKISITYHLHDVQWTSPSEWRLILQLLPMGWFPSKCGGVEAVLGCQGRIPWRGQQKHCKVANFANLRCFHRLCGSLHHFALRPLERHDGRKYLPPARC